MTPYSRNADGRAVLRSSIREFLCSEAMYWLNIPTTRAATIITSDSFATRDLRYDGHPIQERCTVVLRLAPSFLRFGSYEICRKQDPVTGREGPSPGNVELLKKMVDYTIQYFYPHIWNSKLEENSSEMQEFSLSSEEKKSLHKHNYAQFYSEVVDRSAYLVAQWMAVGWAHGVLNTDNCSILGLTIDYGPFGFLDIYNPDFICNGSGILN